MLKKWEYILLLVVAATATSCSEINRKGYAPSLTADLPSTVPNPVPTIPTTKEEELAQLVLEFKTHYNASFNYVIDFKPSSYMNSGGGSTTVGVCEVYSDGSKQIHFNENWWPTVTAVSKKIITFHELGHCFFNRAHDNRAYSGGRPYSLMNAFIDPLVLYFPQYTNYYLNELQSPIALSVPSYPITFKTNSDGECSEE